MYKYGYVILEAVNETMLEWKWVQNNNSIIYGRMVITQIYPIQPWILPIPDKPFPSNSNNSKKSLIIVIPIILGLMILIILLCYDTRVIWYHKKLKSFKNNSNHSNEMTTKILYNNKENNIRSDDLSVNII